MKKPLLIKTVELDNPILNYLKNNSIGKWLIVDNKECRFLGSPLSSTNTYSLASHLGSAHLFTDEEMRYTMAESSDLTAIKA